MDLMKRLGFRTADEMDAHIALSAARTSWIVILSALLIWSFYEFIRIGKLTPPFILLSLGLAVYFAAIIYRREKLGSSD